MQHKTIKSTRKELREWGRYWAGLGSACNSKSSMAAFIEAQLTATVKTGQTRRIGVKATQTRSGRQRDLSDQLLSSIPYHVNDLDRFINKLRPEIKLALAGHYIKGKQNIEKYWLVAGEQAVMARE
jgi:hypothetical protein